MKLIYQNIIIALFLLFPKYKQEPCFSIKDPILVRFRGKHENQHRALCHYCQTEAQPQAVCGSKPAGENQLNNDTKYHTHKLFLTQQTIQQVA